MTSIVYDTGALLAAERRDFRFVRMHRNRTTSQVPLFVPVVVLAQAWRDGKQHGLIEVLKDCEITPDTERIGRAAGEACARSGTSDVVDAIVVVTALAHGSAVVSSDPSDLRKIAAALGKKLDILVV
ncbi:MAG: PIN domain-containing protein [Hamadaea sp.]|uniref:PIN domain-containing protein n=1 Tax=Hamadaea sp. TaxID=2024425 RepID=UPI00180CD31E|nr:PIN domain-containing protein [Hamadaea sp.]NUR69772.1 PIN domain-containing protein [Hamadaea sp.]NUT20148.1 PIN domain-containing protein [Hamadaea sp.]